MGCKTPGSKESVEFHLGASAEGSRRIAGVLWSGDHLFEGTVETLELLRSRGLLSAIFVLSSFSSLFAQSLPPVLTLPSGKQIVFVTNNSTKSRADYIKKLSGMGIPAEVVRLLTPLLSLTLPIVHPIYNHHLRTKFSVLHIALQSTFHEFSTSPTTAALSLSWAKLALSKSSIPSLSGTLVALTLLSIAPSRLPTTILSRQEKLSTPLLASFW